MKRSEFLKKIGLPIILLPAVPKLLAKEKKQIIEVNDNFDLKFYEKVAQLQKNYAKLGFPDENFDVKIHEKDEENVNIFPSSGLI